MVLRFHVTWGYGEPYGLGRRVVSEATSACRDAVYCGDGGRSNSAMAVPVTVPEPIFRPIVD